MQIWTRSMVYDGYGSFVTTNNDPEIYVLTGEYQSEWLGGGRELETNALQGIQK